MVKDYQVIDNLRLYY